MRAKLTLAQVDEIRANTEAITQTELGRRYGVTRETIGLIRNGRTWNVKIGYYNPAKRHWVGPPSRCVECGKTCRATRCHECIAHNAQIRRAGRKPDQRRRLSICSPLTGGRPNLGEGRLIIGGNVVCRRCSAQKPGSAFMPKQLICRECKSKYDRARYELLHEEVLQKTHQWYQANRGKAGAISRAWAKANPDLVRKYKAKNRATHREERAADGRRRRARLLGVGGSVTPAEWDFIKTAWKGRCAYCHRKTNRLTQDHVVPVTKGGRHSIQNIVPACQSCNSRKGAGPPLKPVQIPLVAG